MSEAIYNNFIKDDRWKYITDGLKVTLEVTLFAVLIGIAIGFLVAVIRSTYDKTGKLKLCNFICKLYLTIIRGTPVLVQLMIIYFVIFGSVKISKVVVAVISFGINSGPTLRRFSEAVLCLWTRDSSRLEGAWALPISKRCGILLCRRHLKMFFLLWAMSLFPC